MPKQQKKVITTEEYEESESDHVESATDEENESEAGESEADDSVEAESEEEEDGGPAVDANDSESDEDDEDEEDDEGGDSDEDEEADESEEDEEMDVKNPTTTAESEDDDEEEEEEDDEDDDEEDDDEEDDDEEVDDDEDVPTKTAGKKSEDVLKGKYAAPEFLVKNVTKQLTERYGSRKGLQLFIRLPEKLPEDFKELEEKMMSISSLIVKVHKPRQKHARFCLVDFANQEDRDKAYKELSENKATNKLIVSLPRTEDENFIKKLIKKRLQKIEKARATRILKKEGKKAAKQTRFTSNLVVFNIPKSASIAQVKELFPDAVDIQLKPAPKKFIGVCTAAITCKSTVDATENQKRKLTLGANKLIIRFDSGYKRTRDAQADSKEEGVPTESSTANGGKPKNKKKPAPKLGETEDNHPKPTSGKKRTNQDDGTEQVPEKKIKSANEQKTKAKQPPNKQTQLKNGNAKAVTVKQNQQQKNKENGKPPQKKGGASQQKEDKPIKQSPQKGNAPEKKPFAKKQHVKKIASKKAKLAAK